METAYKIIKGSVIAGICANALLAVVIYFLIQFGILELGVK